MRDDRYDVLCGAAGDVSRETFERLIIFERLFVEWNKRINLISRSSANSLWSRHIADCAQLVSIAKNDSIWLDIGSGGGFPGAVVAIMIHDVNGAHVNLVESNGKKAAFLRRVITETGAPGTVHDARIEALGGQFGQSEIVTARAVASLTGLFALTGHWLENGARALFQKGRDYRREIEDCRDDWAFDLVEHPSRSDPEGIILEVSNLRKLGAI